MHAAVRRRGTRLPARPGLALGRFIPAAPREAVVFLAGDNRLRHEVGCSPRGDAPVIAVLLTRMRIRALSEWTKSGARGETEAQRRADARSLRSSPILMLLAAGTAALGTRGRQGDGVAWPRIAGKRW